MDHICTNDMKISTNMNFIVGLVQYEVQKIEKKVNEILKDRPGGQEISQELADVFKPCNVQPFIGLETEYQQTAYFKDKLKLLVGQVYDLMKTNYLICLI